MIYGFLLGACAGQADQAQPTQTAVAQPSASPLPAETPIEEEQATATSQPALKLSELVYSSPSKAFNVNLPQDWNCSETDTYRVDCHNAEESAVFSMRVTGTGYELLQEDFLSFVQAELVSVYGLRKAYNELSRETSEGTAINDATWRAGDIYWRGIDRFVRSGPAVYHLGISSLQGSFEDYRAVFDQIVQTTELNPAAMSGKPLYALTKEYVSRELIFNLKVPTSWSKFIDAASIDERTVVEGFLAPDKRASVQVVIFSKGSLVTQEVKASKTLEIMRKLYGYDLRASTDKVLPDGREQLEWYAARRGISGITYFDSAGTSIFIFSVVWNDATKYLYKPVLDEVIASFQYK